jgi:hypothetical protein
MCRREQRRCGPLEHRPSKQALQQLYVLGDTTEQLKSPGDQGVHLPMTRLASSAKPAVGLA